MSTLPGDHSKCVSVHRVMGERTQGYSSSGEYKGRKNAGQGLTAGAKAAETAAEMSMYRVQNNAH